MVYVGSICSIPFLVLHFFSASYLRIANKASFFLFASFVNTELLLVYLIEKETHVAQVSVLVHSIGESLNLPLENWYACVDLSSCDDDVIWQPRLLLETLEC
mgnify:CR=1 FL=1